VENFRSFTTEILWPHLPQILQKKLFAELLHYLYMKKTTEGVHWEEINLFLFVERKPGFV
jgi:hypothetical protein